MDSEFLQEIEEANAAKPMCDVCGWRPGMPLVIDDSVFKHKAAKEAEAQ